MASLSIITLLKHDHKEFNDLLQRAQMTDEHTMRAALSARINEALTLHTSFLEEMIYPVLEQQEETNDDALAAIEEHLQIKTLLRDLAGMDTEGDAWKAKITVLAEVIKHHVKEEESDGGLFDELADILDHDDLLFLAEEYTALKEEADASSR